ncbi:MAG: TIGR00282 family metallophosphoesterase [Candidatus Komeilibacteria bacterium]
MSKVKIIFFGDIMGKIGRSAVAHIIPVWQKKYSPNVLIANVENLAHGKGVTDKTLKELVDSGINIMTSGNHVWRKEDANYLAQKAEYNLITPHNDPRTPAGQGYGLFTIDGIKIFTANLLAEDGMVLVGVDDTPENKVQSPFTAVDELLKLEEYKKVDISLVDFHAEYTSEARALGWYLDGKVSAVWGTHTHIPTADAQILPKGTGYITDVGMVGAYESVLGIEKDTIIDRFLNKSKIVFKAPETGKAEINAIYLEIDTKTKKTIKIELLREMVEIN